MFVTAYGARHECAKAVKGPDFVQLYNECNQLITSFEGISDFEGYEIEGGGWSGPLPTAQEQLQADVDYLLIAEMTREGLLW